MPEEIQSFKQVRSVLDPLTIDNSAKAAAFDAFYDSPNEQELKKRFDKLNIPKESYVALFNLKFGKEQARLKKISESATPSAMGELAVNELPAIGATVGGVMGLPGEIAGGALGTAARRAILTRKGQAPVPTAGEFATEAGLGGLEQGAYSLGGRAVGAGLRGLSKAGLPLYKGTLSFTGLDSLPARREAAKQGLRLRAPTSELAGLPKMEQFVSDMTAKVDAEVAKAQAAGILIDTERIMAPVREQVAEYAKSLAPTAPTKAAREIEKDIVLRLGGEEIDVAGPGGTIVKQLRPGPRYQNPVEIQEAKRATSRTLRKTYGEEKGPAIETQKAGEFGAKEAMEAAVPSVHEPNWQEHIAITLKDAMERSLKAKPGFLRDWTPYIIGSAVGGAVGLSGAGMTHATEAGVVAALVREAIRNPNVMSRLAIALDRAGTTLPKIAGPATKYGLRFGMPLLSDPMPPSSFEPPR